MKLQIAYDTLAVFLNQNNAGLAEQEALKSLAAYCKGIVTKAGGVAPDLAPLPTAGFSGQAAQSTAPASPSVNTRQRTYQKKTHPSFAQSTKAPTSPNPMFKRHEVPEFAQPQPGIPTGPNTKNQQKTYGKPWTKEEESRLAAEYLAGWSAADMAASHRRTVEAIAARLKKCGIIKNRWDLKGYDEYRRAVGTPFPHD